MVEGSIGCFAIAVLSFSSWKMTVTVPHPRKELPPGTVRSIYRQAKWAKDRSGMAHYIALVHKDGDGCYGVSFPDVPGVITAGDTLDEALAEAAEALAFAAEGWAEDPGGPFPPPRNLDDLRADTDFMQQSVDAVVAAVSLKTSVGQAA